MDKDIDGRVSIRVDEWLEWHGDEFFVSEDIIRFYNWQEVETKKAVLNRLYYLTKTCKPPMLKKVGRQYRLIQREAEIIRWKNADKNAFFDIRLPFDLHDYIRLHPRSVLILGGVSNEGKTTFAHNVIALNIKRHKVLLLDSENSAQELAGRFCQYEGYMEWPEDFVKDRSSNFSDLIGENADGINIIDYLEVYENFSLVAKYIREIRDALVGGIAIVVLQKRESTAKFPSKLPVGGEFSRHLARSVITIDKGILTIIKAKDRAQKQINPVNMKFQFTIDNTGTHFLNTGPYHGD